MQRSLSFFKGYKCYDSSGYYCGTLHTHLSQNKGVNASPVKKISTDRGPHGFLWTADVDESLKWIISQGFDVEYHVEKNDEDKQSDLSKLLKEKNDTIRILSAEINDLQSKVLDATFLSQPPLHIMKSKKEIMDNAKIFDLKCGIYFLINNGEIVYIGQSVNFESRIASHIKDNEKQFTHYSYDICQEKDLTIMEALYIKYFSPVYNKSSPMAKDELTDIINSLE